MKKYLQSALGVAAVLSLFVGQSVLAAPVKSAPKYSTITTSNPQVMKNDKFFVSINLLNAKNIKKTELKMDGQVIKTCGSVVVCSGEIGTFADDELGEHTYSFLITGKNGVTSEPWGKFEVLDGDVTQYGSWFKNIRVRTASYQPEIGKKVNLLVYTTDKKMDYFMDLAIDNEELADLTDYTKKLHPGAETYSTGRFMPAFKKADTGEHTFMFAIKAPNGDLVESGGSFWVVNKGEILPPENP